MTNIVPEFTFNSDEDVKKFMIFLSKKNLKFHYDDPIETIDWNQDLSENDIKNLSIASERLWQYCNPWEFIERHRDMKKLHYGLTEKQLIAEEKEEAECDLFDEINKNGKLINSRIKNDVPIEKFGWNRIVKKYELNGIVYNVHLCNSNSGEYLVKIRKSLQKGIKNER